MAISTQETQERRERTQRSCICSRAVNNKCDQTGGASAMNEEEKLPARQQTVRIFIFRCVKQTGWDAHTQTVPFLTLSGGHFLG